MVLKEFRIKNFRSYSSPISVNFENFTAFIGKNDVGKSTVLEALDIFFNDGKGTIKIDKDDINVQNRSDGNNDIVMTAVFTDLPEEIVIDRMHKSSLESEYLLNSNGCFEIIKKYINGSSSAKVFIHAFHPTNENCRDLLQKSVLS